MRIRRTTRLAPATLLAALALARLGAGQDRAEAVTLQQQNQALFAQMQQGLALSDAQMAEVRGIFARSAFLGQGNPTVTVHPLTPDECRQRATADDGPAFDDHGFETICGSKLMAPLYDPARETAEQARACVDRYEFPGLPCVYPVVWVRAREAAELCAAMGKRLCDAHEWEGACAGSLQPPDYRFDLAQGVAPESAVARMRAASNRVENARKTWCYGPAYRTGICATGSSKTAGCNGGNWHGCGSNTYPTGSFPACRSPLGVYDLHGNAAEHMNLPLEASQMASLGGGALGVTEMKGSWFIFDRYKAHEDACRWRAPYWHGSRVMDPRSHHNYHLGFRCCRTVGTPSPLRTPPTATPGTGPPGSPGLSASGGGG